MKGNYDANYPNPMGYPTFFYQRAIRGAVNYKRSSRLFSVESSLNKLNETLIT